jgi:hypothetical protein
MTPYHSGPNCCSIQLCPLIMDAFTTSPRIDPSAVLADISHDRFSYHRRYAAATRSAATCSVQPHGVLAVSSRIFMKNVGRCDVCEKRWIPHESSMTEGPCS